MREPKRFTWRGVRRVSGQPKPYKGKPPIQLPRGGEPRVNINISNPIMHWRLARYATRHGIAMCAAMDILVNATINRIERNQTGPLCQPATPLRKDPNALQRRRVWLFGHRRAA